MEGHGPIGRGGPHRCKRCIKAIGRRVGIRDLCGHIACQSGEDALHLAVVQIGRGFIGQPPHGLIGGGIGRTFRGIALRFRRLRDCIQCKGAAARRNGNTFQRGDCQSRRVERAKKVRFGQLKAGRLVARNGVHGIVPCLLHIQISCDRVLGAKGKGVRLACRRHRDRNSRIGKAVVLAGLSRELTFDVQGCQRRDHGIAGRCIQMIVRVIRQRPAAGIVI